MIDSSANTPRGGHSRDSSVNEKIAVFNSLAFQGKQLERKTNDAALKRAMLGREEAENEMRRYRDDARVLRRQVEEGRERERKVGERLENVMVCILLAHYSTSINFFWQESYGRAKETHAHTQTLWEKEIRRARKESFKSQSVIVKLQEELKSSRNTMRMAQVDLEQEKERSLKREQEAFAARYQLVGVQEELAQMQEQIKLVEEERDALRTIAKNEEIARIAAEGRIPLPKCEDEEFASPKKVRKSMDLIMITSSAASEEELDDLTMKWQWERQRAERAHDRIEFLELECRLNCYASRAARHIEQHSEQIPEEVVIKQEVIEDVKVGRLSTIFIPEEGVFRTVNLSPAQVNLSPAQEESPWISPAKKTTLDTTIILEKPNSQRDFARTPSCEPPAPAIISDCNTSLLSLLEAPLSPTRSKPDVDEAEVEDTEVEQHVEESEAEETAVIQTFHTVSTTTRIPLAVPADHTPPVLLPNSLDPALSPTMSREEALAMIRERRGRARSLAQGTMTPRKQMVEGTTRRDISAPAIRSGNVRGKSQARV